ncbi:MAG: 30S ribosomal protein S20 [Anaerolineales bacterium]|nr:30S ribosomal protein S20 [Anaerolineales bacterium]
MANKQSAKKRIRQNEKRRMRNRTVVTRTRTYLKRARMVMDEGDAVASQEAVKVAVSELDRAVSKGVLHAKNGARRKSRLLARLNSMGMEIEPSE